MWQHCKRRSQAVSHCGTTRPSGPIASRTTWIQARSSMKPPRASSPVRGHAMAWSPRLSTRARQPGVPSPPHLARVMGRSKRMRRRSARQGASDQAQASWQGQQGWRQAMPLHVGLLGSAATHGRRAERLAAGHALGKKCEVREQHPVASHSPIYRARHVLPATVLIAGTPPSLVAGLGVRLQPLRQAWRGSLIPGPRHQQATCSSFRAALFTLPSMQRGRGAPHA